jgi:hypothetical protein
LHCALDRRSLRALADSGGRGTTSSMTLLLHIAMHSPAARLLRGAEFRAPSFHGGKAKGGIPLD